MVPSGAEIYEAHCALCHGPDRRGTDVGPPLAGPDVELTAPEVRDAVRHGVSDPTSGFPEMVPVRGLSREQVEAVAAYVTNSDG